MRMRVAMGYSFLNNGGEGSATRFSATESDIALLSTSTSALTLALLYIAHQPRSLAMFYLRPLQLVL